MIFSSLDWWVLAGTLVAIIAYGIYKSRTSKNLEGYFLGDRQMPWWVVLLSIMGTQASAVTFLTAPGQAFTDGMRFVQYYFGLPLAMVILCITLVPVFHRLKVFTAYEYLETRFDLKTRTLTSFLFLLSRGVSTGISVIAPSIVLHSLLGWNFYLTNMAMGGLLIIYTTTGGAKAVAYTQQIQFLIIYLAMFLVCWYAIDLLPEGVTWSDALHIGGKAGKMNILTSGFNESGSFNWNDRYNIWSGIIGGLFLSLSYFGTDQSQVGRYLTARTTGESKLGLLMNGLVKVPLQFFILLIGVFIFAYYQFYPTPLFFDQSREKEVLTSSYAADYKILMTANEQLQWQKSTTAISLTEAIHRNDQQSVATLSEKIKAQENKGKALRSSVESIIKKAVPGADAKDTNYIFLHFATGVLPKGLIGLVIAIIFLAAWGSIAAALNALASCTMVDFHTKFIQKDLSAEQAYRWSKWYTIVWGLFSIIISFFAYNLGNSLIEAVNILGSWFYGTILGIFLVAFYMKKIGGTAVFWAAVVAEAIVVAIYFMNLISFLWLNVIGAIAVMLFAWILQCFLPKRVKA